MPFYPSVKAFYYREFGSRATLWATFNEINVETFCGYIHGQFPPAKLVNFTMAGQYFLNMLKAHTQAYNIIKSLPGNLVQTLAQTHAPSTPTLCLQNGLNRCGSELSFWWLLPRQLQSLYCFHARCISQVGQCIASKDGLPCLG